MQKRRLGGISLLVGTLAFVTYGPSRANADLTLTSAGSDQGFKLTTFADGFPAIVGPGASFNQGIGPLGIGFPAGGGVLVTNANGEVRLFSSAANGQHASDAPVVQNYGAFNAVGLTQLNNSFYLAQQANNSIAQINPNGTLNHILLSGLSHASGIVANPVNGHLFVSSADGTALYEVNPATGTATVFKNGDFDGLSISPDGTKIYAAAGDSIVGFDLATGNPLFAPIPVAGGPDGIAMGIGTLAGNLFVNTNLGTVVDVNLSTQVQTLIATGGSRGDFVAVAPDGSLFLTQTDRIERLSAPAGGGFVTPFASDPTTVPEPASFILVGLGGLALLGWRRWQSFSG